MKTFDEMKHPRGQAANAGQFREVTNSAPTSDLTETEDVAEPGRYRILVDRLRDLGDAIEKANRRLQRAGVTERFEATWVERIWRDEDGRAWHVADVELNRPVISSGEWTFVASHEKAANGKLLSHYVGTGDRDGLEVDPSMRCDHCGRARARQKVYTLRSPQTGETKQIGSNCLQLFLGLRPEGLWSMTAEVGADLAFDADDESWSRVRETNAYEGDELLLATIRQVAEDGSFMSRSRAGLYATPTMDKVKGRV